MEMFRFLFLLILLFQTSCSTYFSVPKALEKIPEEDKKCIERLFKYLIYSEPFAYTLFGTKPFSFTCLPYEFFLWPPFFYADYFVCLKRDWLIWEKYQHLFPIKKYTFIARENDSVFEIYLFNIEECKKTIVSHLKIFQKKLHCTDSANKILQTIKDSSNVYDELGKSQGLYGALLGFGMQNSLYFENYYSHKMYFLAPLNSFNSELPVSLYIIELPDFAVVESEETKQLRKKYTDERNYITEVYAKGDFLEVTLRQLTK
jgi:hypothetical protein